ncbi:MAG: prepilin-type N-terminal cleavage/methylation domain-containing protein [Actinobacteria bacterium]|nr:prepilin-type N-terminal cleavage/methylation domain-containing protein [Actinomycetota bacterium]
MSLSAGKYSHRKIADHEAGLTLVEVLVAMTIFLIISTGVAATMAVGLHSAAKSRQGTSGKDIAEAQFEEMKARPFYVPYTTDHSVGTTAPVDFLSKYYPNLNSSHTVDSQGWTGWYTQSGSDAYYTEVAPAGSQGVTTTVVTRFVDNQGNIIIPPGTYNSAVSGDDNPPSQLVKVSITTSSPTNNSYNYVLNSQIQGDVGTSCSHASNSHVDIFGGTIKVITGTSEPYTALLDGSLGDAHATTGFGCTTSPQASGTGGKSQIFGGDTAVGAAAAISGPPDGQQSAGPIDVTSSDWPTPGFYDSTSAASVGSAQLEVEAEGQAAVSTESWRLQQVDGCSCDTLAGYKTWDFVNPTVTVTGGQVSGAKQIDARLQQANGSTQGSAVASFQQVNILPLQAVDSDTPSALQGIVFVRTFSASASSQANGQPGGINNSLSYSAVIGVFNPDKPASCTGDDCYDLYPSTGPQNPIQTAVNLAQSQYSLQHTLLTEWDSATTDDINNAMAASTDGTTASINIDAMIKISGQFGTEVRRSDADGSVQLINPQGQQQIWLGSVDMSIMQHD